MTLILAIPTERGIIMASDTQYTSGEVRSSGPKIYALNQNCAWAGAGEVALIQRVREGLSGLPSGHTLEQLRDALAQIVRQAVHSLLDLDVLTEYVQGDPNQLLGLHPGDFVFAEYHQGQLRMLHIAANATPEWFSGCFASGNGAYFAYALLQKYQDLPLSLEQAALLAYRVIDETIQVGAYGLDYPIDIWLIGPEGLNRLEAPEFAQLAKASEALRDQEIQLLLQSSLHFATPKRHKPKPSKTR